MNKQNIEDLYNDDDEAMDKVYTKTNLKIQNNFFIFQTYILSNFFGVEKISKCNYKIIY
jgi:hypothetical protein